MANIEFEDFVNGLTEETSPDNAADFLVIVDTSGSDVNKIKPNSILGTNLAAIRALTPSNDDVLQRKAGAWTNRTIAQLRADLGMAEILLAVSDETTDLTTGAAKLTFRMPYAMTLTAVRASVNTAPTGQALLVDINENVGLGAVSIFSTRLSIDATEKTSTTAASPAVISDASLADDAEITIDIDQVGSGAAGKGLKVWLIGTRA